jgi:hypothetical protein
MPAILRRRTLLAMLFVSAFTVSACSDDPVEADPEPEVATLRLVIGTQTVSVNVASGVVTGGPVVIARGNTNVTATFLRADGSAEPLVTGTLFRLDGTSSNNAVLTYTSTGPFTGTLNGLQAGNGTVTFALFHLEEGHNEWSRAVSIQVQ